MEASKGSGAADKQGLLYDAAQMGSTMVRCTHPLRAVQHHASESAHLAVDAGSLSCVAAFAVRHKGEGGWRVPQPPADGIFMPEIRALLHGRLPHK